MISQLGTIGVLLWFENFAYKGDHVKWNPTWVVPVQWAVFIIIVGVQIICIALLIFPKDWFVKWADKEVDRIKSK